MKEESNARVDGGTAAAAAGAAARTVTLRPGAVFAFEGQVVEVIELAGTQVTLRVRGDAPAGGWRTLRVADFAARATSLETGLTEPRQDEPPVGTVLAGLSEQERERLAERAGHVREVLTGFRSGSPELRGPGEPRPEFDLSRSSNERYAAKAAELGISARTVRRWVRGYRESGEAGLVDARRVSGRGHAVDPWWEQAVRQVLAELVPASTPTAGAVLARVDARLDEEFGPGQVRRPSTATAYRHLGRLTNGTGALTGSAKARRSIADRPAGPYGRLRATRPGEYVVLDTQNLDVFAMEPVTCRWVPVQLTVAQDLFSRCIVGLRVTAVSTKAVDVAGVLYQAMVPQPASEQWLTQGPAQWPAELVEQACWPYHGVPGQLVFTEHAAGSDGQDGAAGAAGAGRQWSVAPVCAPETLVVDHGKAFLSAHVIGVCTRLGISIQPAQPAKPTDKPTVERFFRTLREGLIQYLPAYKGPDVYSRGEQVEDQAFFFLHELEEVIREWIALVYHRTRQDGLAIPEWPRLGLSPNEMFEAGIAKAGMLRIPATPDLVYDFLPVVPRTIQHYGVENGGLRYDGHALNPYRGSRSPYGGALAGRWPIRVNPDDVRQVYFQDPDDGAWHALAWEHAAGLGTPFSAEAARYARGLAARTNRWPDPARALADLLNRWDTGMVTDRRERRMAIRLGAERAALPDPLSGSADPAEQVAALPSLADTSLAVPGAPGDDTGEDTGAGEGAVDGAGAGMPTSSVTAAQLHLVEPSEGSAGHRADHGAGRQGTGASRPEEDAAALVSDDDDAEELSDDLAGPGGRWGEADFYADAFEVIE